MSSAVEIAVGNIAERDIDFLLLDEFSISREFGEWALERCGVAAVAAMVLSVHRSKTDSVGESDLEITYSLGNQVRLRLLIENKIDAQMQPRQGERYRERGQEDLERGECHDFRTVLIAPNAYLAGIASGTFDCYIAYEEVLDWFRGRTKSDSRASTKLRLMELALERSRQGWQLVENQAVTRFWIEYARLCSEIAPKLVVPETARRPAGSSFLYFRQPQLPRSVSLCHKIEHGFVDLQIANQGDACSFLEEVLRDHLLPEMRITKAGESAAIRISVRPLIRMQDGFSTTENVVRKSIQIANAMLDWYLALPVTVRRMIEK
jgi:hypothetical protein